MTEGPQRTEELQTDYLDAILIHGTPGIQQMTLSQSMKIHAELVKLRYYSGFAGRYAALPRP